MKKIRNLFFGLSTLGLVACGPTNLEALKENGVSEQWTVDESTEQVFRDYNHYIQENLIAYSPLMIAPPNVQSFMYENDAEITVWLPGGFVGMRFEIVELDGSTKVHGWVHGTQGKKCGYGTTRSHMVCMKELHVSKIE